MTKKLKNIPLKLFRQYLEYKGLKVYRRKGGHEVWGSHKLQRPIVLQSHIDPIPEFIIRNSLRTLEVDADDFYSFIENL